MRGLLLYARLHFFSLSRAWNGSTCHFFPDTSSFFFVLIGSVERKNRQMCCRDWLTSHHIHFLCPAHIPFIICFQELDMKSNVAEKVNEAKIWQVIPAATSSFYFLLCSRSPVLRFHVTVTERQVSCTSSLVPRHVTVTWQDIEAHVIPRALISSFFFQWCSWMTHASSPVG